MKSIGINYYLEHKEERQAILLKMMILKKFNNKIENNQTSITYKCMSI